MHLSGFFFSVANLSKQWRIQGMGPGPPLFLEQTEAQRAENFFLRQPPPPLSQGLDEIISVPQKLLFYPKTSKKTCTVRKVS